MLINRNLILLAISIIFIWILNSLAFKANNFPIQISSFVYDNRISEYIPKRPKHNEYLVEGVSTLRLHIKDTLRRNFTGAHNIGAQNYRRIFIGNNTNSYVTSEYSDFNDVLETSTLVNVYKTTYINIRFNQDIFQRQTICQVALPDSYSKQSNFVIDERKNRSFKVEQDVINIPCNYKGRLYILETNDKHDEKSYLANRIILESVYYKKNLLNKLSNAISLSWDNVSFSLKSVSFITLLEYPVTLNESLSINYNNQKIYPTIVSANHNDVVISFKLDKLYPNIGASFNYDVEKFFENPKFIPFFFLENSLKTNQVNGPDFEKLIPPAKKILTLLMIYLLMSYVYLIDFSRFKFIIVCFVAFIQLYITFFRKQLDILSIVYIMIYVYFTISLFGLKKSNFNSRKQCDL